MKTAKKKTRKPRKVVRVLYGVIDEDGDFEIHSKKPAVNSPTALAHGLAALDSYLKWFCRADAGKFFNLRGLNKMQPRKFRITTERLP